MARRLTHEIDRKLDWIHERVRRLRESERILRGRYTIQCRECSVWSPVRVVDLHVGMYLYDHHDMNGPKWGESGDLWWYCPLCQTRNRPNDSSDSEALSILDRYRSAFRGEVAVYRERDGSGLGWKEREVRRR